MSNITPMIRMDYHKILLIQARMDKLADDLRTLNREIGQQLADTPCPMNPVDCMRSLAFSLAAKTIDVACDQLRPTLLHMMDVEALLVEADRASKQESSDADHKEVHHAHVN